MTNQPTPAILRWTVLATIALVVLLATASALMTRSKQYPQARACSFNLKQIQRAKLAWASMTNPPGDSPREEDLFGPAHELKNRPVCPSGGLYTIGKVSEKPTCSIAEHNR